MTGGRFWGWRNQWFGRFLLGYHNWIASWKPSEPPNTHCADVYLKQKFTIFGIKLIEIDFKITQVGPLMVILQMNSSSLGGFDGVYVQAITPIDSNKQKIVHHIYMNQSVFGKFLSKFLLHGQSGMVINY